MHDAAFQVVGDLFPSRASIVAPKDGGFGAFLADPQVRPPLSSADINDAVLVFGDSGAVVVSFRRNILPVAGAVQASEAGFAAREVDHARASLASTSWISMSVNPSLAGFQL